MRLKFIDRMLPSLVEEPPSGGDWLHEAKHDGYAQLILDRGDVRAFTRRGFDWTDKYQPIVSPCCSSCAAVRPCDRLVLDQGDRR